MISLVWIWTRIQILDLLSKSKKALSKNTLVGLDLAKKRTQQEKKRNEAEIFSFCDLKNYKFF